MNKHTTTPIPVTPAVTRTVRMMVISISSLAPTRLFVPEYKEYYFLAEYVIDYYIWCQVDLCHNC